MSSSAMATALAWQLCAAAGQLHHDANSLVQRNVEVAEQLQTARSNGTLQDATNKSSFFPLHHLPANVPDAVLIPVPVLAPLLIPDLLAPTLPPTPIPTPAPPVGPARRPYKCEDIHEAFSCKRALILFGFDCVGFGGEWCVPADQAKCSDFTSPVLCNRARSVGLGCIGWTGVSCIR
eukprot:CAMPEP_0171090552 /NCGR_PEP_ID=MMETSP0766_2-20121228/31929_1 /TAXON_ID=439317 /ORGANISM="Gambierdiscus australes, Strain CAWD 149" /LENGTH=177 /DNA_ID=CAMNT_0011548555 /DNA_START=58 /DNA_END=591 /DNA_ORIENTATION=+